MECFLCLKNIEKLKDMKKNKYLVLNEEHNALDYLIQALVFLSQVEQNLFYLKWFAVAFHGALYAFMLLVIQGRNQDHIYEILPNYVSNKDKEKEFDPFDGKLISFLNAYKYIKNSTKMSGMPFATTENHDQCIKELNNKLRSQMVHFKPMLWGAEAWYPAVVCQPLLDLLRFCIKDEKVHLGNSEKKLALAYIESLDKLLANHVEQGS